MIDEVGLLPYSERLGVLKLTTLIERRTRGDLIEVFKSKKDLSNINGALRFGRSGLNIILKSNGSGSAKLKTFKRNFINERVKSFWNYCVLLMLLCSNNDIMITNPTTFSWGSN